MFDVLREVLLNDMRPAVDVEELLGLKKGVVNEADSDCRMRGNLKYPKTSFANVPTHRIVANALLALQTIERFERTCMSTHLRSVGDVGRLLQALDFNQKEYYVVLQPLDTTVIGEGKNVV